MYISEKHIVYIDESSLQLLEETLIAACNVLSSVLAYLS